MVTWENYEEYIILYVDGELNDADRKALMDFLALHPELQDELKAYQATMLVPDITQVFAGRNDLLKPRPAGKIMNLGQWWMYGAAAGIIIIVLFMASRWLNTGRPGTETVDIAKQEVKRPERRQTVPAQPVIGEPVIPGGQSAPIAKNGARSNVKKMVRNGAAIGRMDVQMIKPAAPGIALELTLPEPLPVDAVTIPAGGQEVIAEQQQSGLLAWLPVNEEKKEGLQNLKNNVNDKIEKAKSFKDHLKDTEFALKLGNKELFVINF